MLPLSHLISSHLISSHPITSHSIIYFPITLHPNPTYLIPSISSRLISFHPILSYSIPFHSIPSHFNLSLLGSAVTEIMLRPTLSVMAVTALRNSVEFKNSPTFYFLQKLLFVLTKHDIIIASSLTFCTLLPVLTTFHFCSNNYSCM